MIIVKITPGLGNQMAQFAFYLKQCTAHKDVKIDNITDFHWFAKRHHNGYELEKIFHIEGNYASFKDITRLSKYKNVRMMIIVQRIIWALKKKSISKNNNFLITSKQSTSLNDDIPGNSAILSYIKSYVKKIIYNNNAKYFVEDNNTFYEDFLENTDIYYIGHWLNIDYYCDIMDSIYEVFSFKKKLDIKNEEMLRIISTCCSVSVHIRRGDYLSYNNVFKKLGVKYYSEAIAFLEEKLQCKPTYFIFSDDTSWAKDNFVFFEDRQVYFIDWNSGENSYIDMQLMSNCKHNIIANSSFSWWASLLNHFEDKIIISPENYYTDEYKVKTGKKDDTLLRYPENVAHFKIKN